MKKTILIIFILFSVFYIQYSINIASAASGLLPCTGTGCKFCDLFKLAENVLNFAIFKIAFPLMVIFIVYGGFVIMTAGDSGEKVSSGRKIIQTAIIGVAIALIAWLAVDILIQLLSKSSIQWWNPASVINCS